MSERQVETEHRRIRACVKACEGISTALLEEDVIAQLVAACVSSNDTRVQSMLKLLVDSTARFAEPGTGVANG